MAVLSIIINYICIMIVVLAKLWKEKHISVTSSKCFMAVPIKRCNYTTWYTYATVQTVFVLQCWIFWHPTNETHFQ